MLASHGSQQQTNFCDLVSRFQCISLDLDTLELTRTSGEAIHLGTSKAAHPIIKLSKQVVPNAHTRTYKTHKRRTI